MLAQLVLQTGGVGMSIAEAIAITLCTAVVVLVIIFEWRNHV